MTGGTFIHWTTTLLWRAGRQFCGYASPPGFEIQPFWLADFGGLFKQFTDRPFVISQAVGDGWKSRHKITSCANDWSVTNHKTQLRQHLNDTPLPQMVASCQTHRSTIANRAMPGLLPFTAVVLVPLPALPLSHDQLWPHACCLRCPCNRPGFCVHRVCQSRRLDRVPTSQRNLARLVRFGVILGVWASCVCSVQGSRWPSSD